MQDADRQSPGEAKPAHSWLPGKSFGRYVLTREIGRGAMGTVYEAQQTDLKRRVAVKTLHRPLADDPAYLARFFREGEAAVRIRHPHVVEVLDVGTYDRTPFLVMEYLEGEDLGARLTRLGRLPLPQALEILLPVFAAVATAHEAGVIHRDLKPDNIFLVSSRRGPETPKVVDFGISKFADTSLDHARLTSSASLLGTPLYMSPEQAMGRRNTDAHSDQYALGVILYECVTGQTPYEAETLLALVQCISSGAFVPPSQRASDVPPALERVILRAMALSATDRFSSVWSFGAALLPFASDAVRARWSEVFNHVSTDAPPPPISTDRSLPASPEVPTASPVGFVATEALQGRSKIREVTVADSAPSVIPAPAPTPAALPVEAPTKLSRGVAAVGAAVVAFGLMLAGGWALRVRSAPAAVPTPPVTQIVARPAPAVLTVRVQAVPATATLTLDDEAPSVGTLHRELPRDGREHSLLVRAPGYISVQRTFRDEPPPEHLALTPELALPPAPAIAPPVAARPTRPRPRETTTHGANRAPILH